MPLPFGKNVTLEDCRFVMDGDVAVPIKHLAVDCATNGENILVPLVSGKILVAVQLWIQFSGAVDVTFNDGTVTLVGGTNKLKFDNTGAVGAGGIFTPIIKQGIFETAAVGRPIRMNMSAGVGAAGVISYYERSA